MYIIFRNLIYILIALSYDKTTVNHEQSVYYIFQQYKHWEHNIPR
jgi:hypothetical protein